jgi:hypothetical protein
MGPSRACRLLLRQRTCALHAVVVSRSTTVSPRGHSVVQGPETMVRVTGKSGIFQARNRLGFEPMKRLHDELVKPVATEKTRGAWYRHWQRVSIDGSALDVADTKENEAYFKRSGASRGNAAYPQLRLVVLVENGTHALFGSQIGGIRTAESTLADQVIESLELGFLCLADRNFFSFSLWNKAQ